MSSVIDEPGTALSPEEEAAAAYRMLDLAREAFSDLQRVMDRDEGGWQLLESLTNSEELSADFRKRQGARNTLAAIANPLIRRGVELRQAYIWGDGVTINVDDRPDQGQDVNAIIQGFLDDPQNQATFSTLDAHLTHEKALCTHGVVWFCLPTNPLTARVRVRTLNPNQMTDIITDPEDEATVWFYRRDWVAAGESSPRVALYPALGYRPATRPNTYNLGGTVGNVPILWDQPVLHVAVNKIGRWGSGDILAAVAWADAYKGFLEDWKAYMHALTQIAWRATTRGDKVSRMAADMAQATIGPAGKTFTSDPGSTIETANKGGATINADSGRPLAAMVAAALGIPVTTLLGDPGVTGARATAETVSADSEDVWRTRQQMWHSVINNICQHVIDSHIIAPGGNLRGTIVRDGDHLRTHLPDGDSRTINVAFPDHDSTSITDKVTAVQALDRAQLFNPLTIIRMYLDAYGAPNPDEIIDKVTDENGDWLPLDVIIAERRQELADAGYPTANVPPVAPPVTGPTPPPATAQA